MSTFNSYAYGWKTRGKKTNNLVSITLLTIFIYKYCQCKPFYFNKLLVANNDQINVRIVLFKVKKTLPKKGWEMVQTLTLSYILLSRRGTVTKMVGLSTPMSSSSLRTSPPKKPIRAPCINRINCKGGIRIGFSICNMGSILFLIHEICLFILLKYLKHSFFYSFKVFEIRF